MSYDKHKTFTAEQIVQATMEYHDGCTSGKRDFLREAFGITPTFKRRFYVTVEVIADTYDADGDEIDESMVGDSVADVTHDGLRSALSLDETPDVSLVSVDDRGAVDD